MIYDVILSREDDKYVARVKEWPDVVVENLSREEAVRQVRERLADYLTRQFVRVPFRPCLFDLNADGREHRQVLACTWHARSDTHGKRHVGSRQWRG